MSYEYTVAADHLRHCYLTKADWSPTIYDIQTELRSALGYYFGKARVGKLDRAVRLLLTEQGTVVSSPSFRDGYTRTANPDQRTRQRSRYSETLGWATMTENLDHIAQLDSLQPGASRMEVVKATRLTIASDQARVIREMLLAEIEAERLATENGTTG